MITRSSRLPAADRKRLRTRACKNPRRIAAGGELLPLPAWHEGALRDLCFGELFPRSQTRATQLLLTATLPRPAGPPEGYPARRMH